MDGRKYRGIDRWMNVCVEGGRDGGREEGIGGWMEGGRQQGREGEKIY